MGTAVSQNTCASYSNQIHVHWEVWGGTKLVASGVERGWPSNSGWTDSNTARMFGGFVGVQGVEYKMKIDVLQNGVLLKAAEPIFHIYSCLNPANAYIECRP